MQRDYGESLLRSGIIEAKAGENGTARRYLERAVSASGEHDVLSEAWYWLSKVTPTQRRNARHWKCLSLICVTPAHAALWPVLDGKLDEKEIINPDALVPFNPLIRQWHRLTGSCARSAARR